MQLVQLTVLFCLIKSVFGYEVKYVDMAPWCKNDNVYVLNENNIDLTQDYNVRIEFVFPSYESSQGKSSQILV